MPEPENGTIAKGNSTKADFTGGINGAPLLDMVKAIADGKIVGVSTTAFPLGEIIGKLTRG